MNQHIIISLARSCRPRQWLKNLIIFAPALFSFRLDFGIWSKSFYSFITFCLISSGIYIINDVFDKASDSLHPRKKFRPIASGDISIFLAIIFSLLLCTSSIFLSTYIANDLTLLILTYLVIHFLYSSWMKKKPQLELFCISSGFLIRSLAGGVATNLPISPWFLLTVSLLSIFLAIEKRKAELLNETIINTGKTRFVLDRYSMPLLLRMESLISTSSFISYSLWASGPLLGGAQSDKMILTVPFVLAGIFRYQLLSDPDEIARRKSYNPLLTCERPEDMIFNDKVLRNIVLSWILITVIIGFYSYYDF